MIMREELLCDEIYKTWLSIVLFQQFTSEEYIAFLCTTSTNNNIFVDYNLKELGTIKRFYSVYDVYYGLLHFIQPSVITKCDFIPEKRS